MNGWVFQWPKGTWSIRCAPFEDQPVVLAMFVFSEVSSLARQAMRHANGVLSARRNRRVSVLVKLDIRPISADRAVMRWP